MSRSTTTNFDTQNAISPKAPRVFMDFGQTDRYYSSGDYAGTAYEVYDSFDDDDGTAIASHTMNLGHSWTVDGGSASIQSNELDITAGSTRIYTTASSADCIIVAQFYNTAGSGWHTGIMPRRQDSSNYLVADIIEGTDTLRLYRVVGGVPAGTSSTAFAPANNTEYTLTVTVSGTTFSAHVTDGTNEATISKTESTFQTETDHGIYSNAQNGFYQRFYIAGTDTENTAVKPYIKSFEIDMMNIDVKNGTTERGQCRCRMVDKDLDVSENLIVDNNIHETDIQYKLGLAELAEGDFVDVEKQRIKSIKQLNDPTLLDVFTEDVRRIFQRDQEVFNFRQKTKLNANLADTDTTATVINSTGFVDPSDLWTEIEFVYPVLIIGDREAAWYDSISSSTVFDFDTTAKRIRGGTPSATHDTGADVSQGVMFMNTPETDNSGPVQPLISMLMTRTNSTDSLAHPYYDLVRFSNGFLGFGLGLTTSEVNILSFERADYAIRTEIEDKSADEINRCFVAYQAVSVYDFISEYLKTLGMFLYVDRKGKIAVKGYDYLEILSNYSAEATLTNNDIVDGSFELSYEEMLNHVELSYIKNPLTEDYEEVKLFQQDESEAAYGLTKTPFLLKHDFFSSTINDQEITDGYLRRFMYLFANPPGKFKIKVPISFINIAPGDYVTITYNRFKDYTGSTTVQGWTAKKSLITGQRVVWCGAKPEIELIGFTWELMDKADLSGISATTIAAGSWDDSDIDLESSAETGNTTTRTSADAYYDEDAIEGEVFRLEIQLTLPSSPANPNNDPIPASDSNDIVLFDLALHLQDTVSDPTASDVFTEEVKGIRYDAGYSGTDTNLDDVGADKDNNAFNLVFWFTSDSGSLTWDRIKVDGYNVRYAADGRDVDAAGNRADVDIVSFTRFGLSTISISEIT